MRFDELVTAVSLKTGADFDDVINVQIATFEAIAETISNDKHMRQMFYDLANGVRKAES